MKAVELEKAYDPKSFEDRIYKLWNESGAFKPVTGGDGPAKSPPLNGGPPASEKSRAYTIVIPPPNVTGVLHLGHGLNNSLQDIVIRYHRMRGEPVLWVPGTDHAGIATQHVVEKRLREQGKSRRDLGREKFIEETWKVAKEHHETIARQLAKIGASVDWSRERFTLDDGLSRAVREVFVSLYERDLLYKGHYLVNWCTTCGTALSDDEVDHENTPGKMYHIRYPVITGTSAAAGDGVFVEIATTRPETMLGDTAVAVNPGDERYAFLDGKRVLLPLAGRELPVVFDTYVDRDFGTGAVKITPAHDSNDWELARRQELPEINILNPDGTLNGNVPKKYRGMKVKEARLRVLEDLKDGGFYIKEEDISHSVGHCYRCHTVIEPFLSDQWFVRMKPLAEKALASWRRGELVFYPKRWENTYRHWLENIRDWCVSRQLWWGHRIPAWSCRECGRTFVSRQDPSRCPVCSSTSLKQDEDVLDTWFSSWLWPFSTLGWENPGCDTPDFRGFYPTSALITAYDIIFFWVARMIMAGLEFTGKAPFRDIYLHGLIRDKQGRKMSKSLGNGIDPLELVDEFGADALKFTLAFMCAQGQDILVDKESFKLGSKFANKIWNASRYILMNLEGRNQVENPKLIPADRWIYSRLNAAAKAMGEAFLSYRFNDASLTAYEYFWNDFCDWYVEVTKLSLNNSYAQDGAERDRAATVLLDVLAESLRLLHPLLPFVTEEIYGKLPAECRAGGGLLITSRYPEYREERKDEKAEADFAFMQELVRMVRTVRSECIINPDKKIRLLARLDSPLNEILRENAAIVKLLAGLGELEIEGLSGQGVRPEGAIGLVGSGFEAFVYIAEAADMAFLKNKFTKEIEKDRRFIASLDDKLKNGNFLKNAPAELIAGERTKLEDAIKRTNKLESYVRDMD